MLWFLGRSEKNCKEIAVVVVVGLLDWQKLLALERKISKNLLSSSTNCSGSACRFLQRYPPVNWAEINLKENRKVLQLFVYSTGGPGQKKKMKRKRRRSSMSSAGGFLLDLPLGCVDIQALSRWTCKTVIIENMGPIGKEETRFEHFLSEPRAHFPSGNVFHQFGFFVSIQSVLSKDNSILFS